MSSVYVVKLKLLMRKVTIKEKPGNWESALDGDVGKKFKTLLKDMDELRMVKSPRNLISKEGQFKEDESREASCSLVYLRWEDSSVKC